MALMLLDGTCPHCLTENAYIKAISCQSLPPAGRHGRWSIIFQCHACSRLTIVEVTDSQPECSSPLSRISHSPHAVHLRNSHEWLIRNQFPMNASIKAPDHTPDRIAAAFVEAQDNLKRGTLETSQLLCRKALDLATKELIGNDNDTLFRRIENLAARNLITPQMAQWAHLVRIQGNESAHSDETSTEEEAQALLDFTETFLLYAFTLPEMVRIKQGNTGAQP